MLDSFAAFGNVVDEARGYHCAMTVPDWPRRFRVMPGDQVPVLIEAERGGRRLGPMRWGWRREHLGPRWLTIGRGETASGKPELRRAFASRRCVVPMSAWYRRTNDNGLRIRWVIRDLTARTVSVLGLWEMAKKDDTEEARFIILTVPALPMLRSINDRMPAVVPYAVVDEWLSPAATQHRLRQLVMPYERELDAFPSNPYEERDGPEMLERIETETK